MNGQYDEFIGVDNLHAAVITEDSEQNYITETPEYFAPTAEIVGNADLSIAPTYYDNRPADNYISEGATTLTLTVKGLPAEKAAKYLGKHYDPVSGRVLDTGDPNPPDVALSFRYDKGKTGHRYYQYLKGKFSGGAEEATTKKNNVEIKTYQLTYTAVVTAKQWEVDGKTKPMKRIFADTADPAFDPEGWFSRVQTPDTATQPSALSLVSSDPVDEGTDITVNSSIILTFNNRIMSQLITLYSEDFEPVEVIISRDDTGKVLTVKPKVDLENNESYTLVISIVSDIHGQSLSNKVIRFSTVE